MGLWIIQRGEHFIKHPDGGLTVASCSRLLPLILPFFLFNKSSPAQTLTTETEETSGWYRFDHSLWSSDFAHTLRQLVSIFFLQLFNQCNSLTICQRTAALWWDGHSDMRRRARRTHMPPLCHFHATTIWKQLVSPDLSQLFPIWNVPTEICERERKKLFV